MDLGPIIFCILTSAYVLIVALNIYRAGEALKDSNECDSEEDEEEGEEDCDGSEAMVAAHLRLTQLLFETQGNLSPHRALRILNEAKGLVRQVGFSPGDQAKILRALQIYSLQAGAMCNGRKKNHSKRKRVR